MRQSPLMSLVEALANVALGYGVAVLTQLLVFPMFKLSATIARNLGIGSSSPRFPLRGATACHGSSRSSDEAANKRVSAPIYI